jgi:hypothetical protein
MRVDEGESAVNTNNPHWRTTPDASLEGDGVREAVKAEPGERVAACRHEQKMEQHQTAKANLARPMRYRV